MLKNTEKFYESLICREMSMNDYEQVYSIIDETINFTKPPPYVFWMILRTQNQLCQTMLIDDKIISYFLAISLNEKNELFIWQFGILEYSKFKKEILIFCKYYIDILRSKSITKLYFTASRKSIKLISALLRFIDVNLGVTQTNICYFTGQSKETEYYIEL